MKKYLHAMVVTIQIKLDTMITLLPTNMKENLS